jgi:hypothetical protein
MTQSSSSSTIPKYGPARVLWDAEDIDDARDRAKDQLQRGGNDGA